MKCRAAGSLYINVAEHRSICEMAENILLLGFVLTSQDVTYGKMQLNENG
jgi:hypothetical protein